MDNLKPISRAPCVIIPSFSSCSGLPSRYTNRLSTMIEQDYLANRPQKRRSFQKGSEKTVPFKQGAESYE